MCKHIVFGVLCCFLLALSFDPLLVKAEEKSLSEHQNEFLLMSHVRNLLQSRRHKRGFTDIDPSNRATETPASTTTSTTPPSTVRTSSEPPQQTTLAPKADLSTTPAKTTISTIEQLKKNTERKMLE